VSRHSLTTRHKTTADAPCLTFGDKTSATDMLSTAEPGRPSASSRSGLAYSLARKSQRTGAIFGFTRMHAMKADVALFAGFALPAGCSPARFERLLSSPITAAGLE